MKQYLFSLFLMIPSILFCANNQQDLVRRVALAIKSGNLAEFDVHFCSDMTDFLCVENQGDDYIDLLGFAAKSKNLYTKYFIKRIIDGGADPNKDDPILFQQAVDQTFPDGTVHASGFSKLVQTFLPIERAIEYGNVEGVSALLENGADVEKSSFRPRSFFAKLFSCYPMPLAQAQKYLSVTQDRPSDDTPGTAEAPGTRAEYKQIIELLQQHIERKIQEEVESNDIGGMGCVVQ
ncbi:MAG: hypothetical protein WD055_05370 [Candidatus Dependentiae bacterium]